MRGSIVKRMSKPKKEGERPTPLYYIVYTVNGKQKWERVPSPVTHKHAEKLLTERLSQIDKGEWIEPTKITFGEFKDVWVEKYARGHVRGTSLDKYQSMFRAQIIPAFGEMELAKIGVEDVQGFTSRLLADGLAPKTVNQYIQLLRQMFGHAIDWGYLRHNPAKKVKGPRIPRREMDCLNPEECRVFLSSVLSDETVPVATREKWYTFFLAAIITGLRLNELLAMKWSNLDWNQGKYFVKETLTPKTETEGRGFHAPKTESSIAPVDLTPRCLDALREHQARQAEEKLQAKMKWDAEKKEEVKNYKDLDLIFATKKGMPLDDKHVVNRVFHPALKAAGLRRIRFHDLRHTCASLLINQGESPKYVQKQMRHASIQMTFDRYGHLFPEASREAVRRLDATLFNSGGRTEAGSAV